MSMLRHNNNTPKPLRSASVTTLRTQWDNAHTLCMHAATILPNLTLQENRHQFVRSHIRAAALKLHHESKNNKNKYPIVCLT